ncbi:probable transcription factor PosF21 [Typha latifolia]|uniref:probable transcription factor PosF21 n=1 Tax=Typha latifolia TaxID=4733 RepID=UPI003C2D7744
MDKDKSPVHEGGGGGLPPSPGLYSTTFISHSSSFPIKCEASSSSSPSPGSIMDTAHFSHDISQMPDYPPRNAGHRRAQSEILSLPDDINFDSDLGIVGSGEGPSISEEVEEDLFSMFIDMDRFTAAGATSMDVQMPPSHSEREASASREKLRVRHQHSQSMDGSTSIKAEFLLSGTEGQSPAEAKKAMSAAQLAELALVDPKRAKRIWANRQSAARSKERKMRYIAELERKVQALQTEATTLSAQLTMLQRDATGLTAENNELKLRLQTMGQQVRLQDALNDALREEIQRLKIATGQVIPNGGKMINFGLSSLEANQQSYHQGHAQSLFAAHQLQQLQIRSSHQQLTSPQQHQNQGKDLLQEQSHAETKAVTTSGTQTKTASDSSSLPE